MGLFAALWILLLWGIMAMIFGFQIRFLYSLFGAIIFALLIIFDTWRILKTDIYEDGNWILAAIDLYLDIVVLFLFILSLIGGSRD